MGDMMTTHEDLHRRLLRAQSDLAAAKKRCATNLSPTVLLTVRDLVLLWRDAEGLDDEVLEEVERMMRSEVK